MWPVTECDDGPVGVGPPLPGAGHPRLPVLGAAPGGGGRHALGAGSHNAPPLPLEAPGQRPGGGQAAPQGEEGALRLGPPAATLPQ